MRKETFHIPNLLCSVSTEKIKEAVQTFHPQIFVRKIKALKYNGVLGGMSELPTISHNNNATATLNRWCVCAYFDELLRSTVRRNLMVDKSTHAQPG